VTERPDSAMCAPRGMARAASRAAPEYNASGTPDDRVEALML
jgi:hypothetical protein